MKLATQPCQNIDQNNPLVAEVRSLLLVVNKKKNDEAVTKILSIFSKNVDLRPTLEGCVNEVQQPSARIKEIRKGFLTIRTFEGNLNALKR